MAGTYRGALKVAGSALRGWLIDTAHPARHVRFNLLIDGEFRGAFVANRRRTSFVRNKRETAEDTHGFSIFIRRAWISGEPQAVRLEHPAHRGIDLSLTAKLGPAPNKNFEEHVVSAHAVLGGRERVPLPEEQVEEARPRIPRLGDPTKPLLKKIAALSDADLASLVLAMERDVLLDRIGRYDRAADGPSIWAFRRLFLGGSFENLLTAFGRGALKEHGHAAVRVLTAAAALFPQSFEANYQAGTANSQHGEFEEALRLLKTADEMEEGSARAKQELVHVIGKMLRVPMPSERRAALRTQQLELLGTLSASENPGVRVRYKVPFAVALYAAGRYDESIAVADTVLAASPNDVKALIVRAKSLIARNRVTEARTAYEHVLGLDSDNAQARVGLRALAGIVVETGAAGANPEHGAIADGWLCIGKAKALQEEDLSVLHGSQTHNLGYLRKDAGDGRKLDFWRREVLAGLRESRLIRDETDVRGLARWKSAYGARRPASSTNTAAVMYRAEDISEGNEGLPRAVAAHHAREGFEPVLVGITTGLGAEVPMNNEIPTVLVPGTVADIRRFLLESEVSFVHAIAGIGVDVAKAIRFTNLTFVCGLHFNGVASVHDPDVFSTDGAVSEHQELLSVLESAGAVYTGSRLAQRAVEKVFGVRCSIISDVPAD